MKIFELNINTDDDGKLIIPDDLKRIIPRNSIVKLVIYSLADVNVEDKNISDEQTENQI